MTATAEPTLALDTIIVCEAGGEWRIGGICRGAVEALAVAPVGEVPRVGRLVLGRAGRKATGIDAMFVEIGEERPALLRAADGHPKGRLPEEGAAVIVQVSRAAVPGKGARVTMRPTLSGPTLIFRPSGGGDTAADLAPQLSAGEGAAFRPASDTRVSAEAAAGQLRRLRALWQGVLDRAARADPPELLWGGPGPVERFLLDYGNPPPERLLACGPGALEALRQACAAVAPDLAGRVQPADGAAEAACAALDAAVAEALDRQVALPGGGTLTIDSTEALTVMDVDAGAAIVGREPEEAALAVNLAAMREVTRQLRLRDIGGAVIIDPVSQRRRDAAAQVLDALRAALRTDPQPVQVFGRTGLGLVELTRQSAAGPLVSRLTGGCSACGGSGRAVRLEHRARAALRHLAAVAGRRPGGRYRLHCSAAVATLLQGSMSPALAALRGHLGGAELTVVPHADYDPARTEVDAG